MKKLALSLIAIAVSLLPVMAQRTQRGPITYYLGFGGYSAEVEDCETDVTEVYVPNEINVQGRIYTVNRFGSDAFRDCRELTSVNIPLTVTYLGAGAFSHCEKLTELVIPDHIDEFRIATFRFCNSLHKINFPSQLKTIGDFCFEDCYAIEEVILPEGLTDINTQSFRDCKAMTRVVLPSTLEFIGEECFMGCRGLKLIEINATNPPETHLRTFREVDCSQIEVIVPDGSLEAYKADPVWKQFFNLHEQSTASIANQQLPGSATIQSVYDINGRQLPDVTGNNLPAGIYIIMNADGTASKRIFP